MRQPRQLPGYLRWIALAVILLLATFLRFWKLEASSFGFDAAAVANLAARFVETGVPPVMGMVSSVGLPNPPLAVYLFSLPVLFTRDPVLLNGFVALLNVVAVWGCYALTRRYWGDGPALLAALLLAVSPWAIYYSRSVWAQDLLLPGILIFMALLLKWLRDDRAWALFGAMATLALLTQLHFAAVALFPVFVLVVWLGRWSPLRIERKARIWPALLAGAALSLALYAPYLLALAQQGDALVALGKGGAGSTGVHWPAFDYALMNIGGRNIHALAGPEQFRNYLATLPSLAYWPDRLEEALVVLGAVYLPARIWRNRADRAAASCDAALLGWLVVPVLFFALLPAATHPHYALVIAPAPHIILAVAVFDLLRLVANREARASRRVLPAVGLLALGLTVGWQTLLIVRLYAFTAATDTPGGLGAPAQILRAVAAVIDDYVAAHPDAEVIAFCPGRDPRWADPRWDECPAVLDFLAADRANITYINVLNPVPPPPDHAGSRLVLVAPGGDAAATQLEGQGHLLRAIAGRPGAGEWQFFEVRNPLVSVAERIQGLGREGDVIVLASPGQRETFARFYQGPLPVSELPSADDAAIRAALDDLGRAHGRLFVVYYGESAAHPSAALEAWLNENGYEAFDAWLGDARLALVGAGDSPEQWASMEIAADFGAQLRLTRARWIPRGFAPGDLLQVELTWDTLRQPETNYSLFLQLLDEAGQVAAQTDALLADAGGMTSVWQVGESQVSRHGLLVPPNTLSGRYILIAGLYRADQPGFPRLVTAAGDSALISEINVR